MRFSRSFQRAAAGLGFAVSLGVCAGLAAVAEPARSPASSPASSPATPPAKAEIKADQKAEGLKFRFVGPAIGNRVASVVGVPGDPNIWYAGAASGGVWKSSDGGERWEPVFDKQPVAAIGALAVAPSDPDTVWAGTGEAWAIRDADIGGDGVYKSADAGKTWTHMGLPNAGRIGRIIVDPANADTVYVCALGRMTAPQQDRGVYKTTDGGKTWIRSLFVDPNTGCSGLTLDAHDRNTLFAGMWQVEMHTWAELSGGPGSGVYVSHDAGKSWKRLDGHGLPPSPVGKIDVAVAPGDSKRVYALIQTNKQGSLWRSDDAGENWKVVSWDRTLTGRAGYYIRLAVSPANRDTVMVSSSSFLKSTDGGVTFPTVRVGGDNHDIWIDPKNADRWSVTFDGGLAVTNNGGKGFHNVTLPIAQMYHVAVDDQTPYFVYGNMQDDGTMRGPSIPRGGGWGGAGLANGWDYHMGGCESGFTLPDPADHNIVWATCYGDQVTRWDARTGQARSVSPWKHTLDSPPDVLKYRCHWTPPLAIDPFDHNTVYYGCQTMFRTSDAGETWSVISPDLSTHDPRRIMGSGGIIGDNLGQFYGEVIFAIGPSPVQRGLIWAGTNDGKVWHTLDGGQHWIDDTANIKGMPNAGVVTRIEPSHFEAGTAYVTVDAHLLDDRDPHVFVTRDTGKTWSVISGGLPRGELGYVRTISEDPNARGVLFVGTGQAFYYSLDDGKSWTRLTEGLPPSPVTWTAVQPRFHDLVVSTWGRGIYVLDDLTPLEARAAAPAKEAVRLFAPRPTYDLDGSRGVLISYELKSVPARAVKIDILDDHGQLVRSFTQLGQSGLNRAAWDLHWSDLRTIQLRTVPPEDPHIWEEARFKGKDVRPITHWGMSARQQGPVAAPGHYQVRLSVDDVVQKADFEVMLDPRAGVTPAEAATQVAFQQRIAADVGRIADRVNLIEVQRKQLADAAATASPQDRAEIEAMDRALQAVEYDYFSSVLAASDDKYFVQPYKPYYDLLWLNAEVGTGAGDVAGGARHAPTANAKALLAQYEAEAAKVDAAYDTLMARDVPAFNARLTARGLKPLPMNFEAKASDVAGFDEEPGGQD